MSFYYPEGQFIVALYSVFVGIALGVLYDVFKIKRFAFGESRLILFFDDLAFMLLSATVLILFVFQANSGRLRWFEVIIPIASFYVYKRTLSKLVLCFMFFLIKTVKGFLRRIFALLWWLLSPIAVVGEKYLKAAKEHFKCVVEQTRYSRAKKIFIKRCISIYQKGS